MGNNLAVKVCYRLGSRNGKYSIVNCETKKVCYQPIIVNSNKYFNDKVYLILTIFEKNCIIIFKIYGAKK